MFLFNKKMMFGDNGSGNGSGGSGTSEASKGTYAYDKFAIDTIKTAPSDSEISKAVAAGWPTENALTYFVSDHFVETDDPDSDKKIIKNHDSILEVDPAKDAAIKAGKEIFDANTREAVAANFNDAGSSTGSGDSSLT